MTEPTRALPPDGQRLVLVSGDLLDLIGTRSERGNRLSYEWGEPDEHGWYTPTITEHHAPLDELDRLREALRQIVGLDYRGNEPPEQAIARAALATEDKP
jgi:hypothetical protein